MAMNEVLIIHLACYDTSGHLQSHVVSKNRIAAVTNVKSVCENVFLSVANRHIKDNLSELALSRCILIINYHTRGG